MSLEIASGFSIKLDYTIEEYLTYAEGLSTAEDVKKLVLQKKYKELEKIMMNRLTFGTAGLRGRMGPGYAAMNELVIIQTSQGLAEYLKRCTDLLKKIRGVVIGYDNRHNSKRFAELAAVAFLLRGFTVHIFSDITPTPFVPFTVKTYQLIAGIMITASHNPKDDNGYKVYWYNGAQINSPQDKRIQEEIEKHKKPIPGSTDTSLVWTSYSCRDPLAEITQMYFGELIPFPSEDLRSCKTKITFTALHGVAHSYMKKAFQYFRYENFIPVQEQMRPDPDFPTVKFPNPEEKNCLDLSIATADKHGSTLIFANDPDADRLAVAEKLNNGEWYIYSGNEIGAMLGSWLWDKAYKDLPVHSGTQKRVGRDKCCMISSAVSSKILKSIATKNKFHFFETLTGFKWMANKAYDWMQEEGNQFVFAFEEALGFMCGPKVMDKDGIQAAMHMSQIAAYCNRRNIQLYDFLKEVYVKYGYHVSCNSYFICDNPDAIKKFFEKLRNYKGQEGKYPERLEYFDIGWFEWIYFPVKDVRDLTTGYDSREPDQRAVLPYGPTQQMITFYFENGCEMTLRTSGTEPKIKYYTEIISTKPESEWKKVDELLHKMVELLIEQWIQPEKNGFSSRPI